MCQVKAKPNIPAKLGMVSVNVCEVPQKLYIFQTPNDIEAQKES